MTVSDEIHGNKIPGEQGMMQDSPSSAPFLVEPGGCRGERREEVDWRMA